MQDYIGALHLAELDGSMRAGSVSSSVMCLAAKSCLPLGGHSVWAAMPPFPKSGDPDRRPVSLVLAGLDGSGFFHDRIRVRYDKA